MLQEFLLDNAAIILLITLIVLQLIQFKIEYFPKKARYSENLLNRYLEYQMYRRYEHETRRVLPQNILYQFDKRKIRDTSGIQRPERNTGNS